MLRRTKNMEIIHPTPAPKYILGSEHYYSWRASDFMSRFINAQPPDYYLNYGDKYVQRFKTDTRPKLSEAGQHWLDRVLWLLQEMMENKLAENPIIELNPTLFTQFAFDSHVQAYQQAGFEMLPLQDLTRIVFTPDVRDLIRFNGIRQILALCKAYGNDHKSVLVLRSIFGK